MKHKPTKLDDYPAAVRYGSLDGVEKLNKILHLLPKSQQEKIYEQQIKPWYKVFDPQI